MKNTLTWMLTAILFCGMIVSSCSKDSDSPNPTPTPPAKKTVLAGINGTGVLVYDNISYTYDYDANYRLTKIKAYSTTDNTNVFWDYDLTYSEDHISIIGTLNSKIIAYELSLDNEGRCTLMLRSYAINENEVSMTSYEYSYNNEGRLITEYKKSMPNGKTIVKNYNWEGEDIISTSSADGITTVNYEISDAPAQAFLSRIGYDSEVSELCAQGCFGKLPKHMPSKRTITTGGSTQTTNYSYTVNSNGRLVASEETSDTEEASYVFNWEEK